jgi:hypothetical protein
LVKGFGLADAETGQKVADAATPNSLSALQD